MIPAPARTGGFDRDAGERFNLMSIKKAFGGLNRGREDKKMVWLCSPLELGGGQSVDFAA